MLALRRAPLLLRARTASTTTTASGRLIPLSSPAVNDVVDLDRRRQRQRQWYADNKDRLSTTRKQRRLVAGLAGLSASALPRSTTARFTLPQLLRALDANRAVAVRVFDIRQVSTLCNYLVVTSAASMRHLEAIAANVARDARSRVQSSPQLASRLAVEGAAQDEWTCLDMGGIVLHVMSEEARGRYDIESRYAPYQVHGDPVPDAVDDGEDDDEVEYRVLR